MSRPARLISFGVVLVALGLFVAGCSRTQESQIVEHIKHGLAFFQRGRPLLTDLRPVQGGWIIQRLGSDIDSLNPITLESSDGQMISGEINEGLLQLNNYTLKLEPCLALSWEVSPDQLTYTFHLRQGVKWHDGQPFTADDVKFTYDKVMDPKVDAEMLRSYFTSVKSCEVLDPYTVRFVTTDKYFKMLEEIGEMPILPRHAFATGNPDFNQNDFARSPIGTGPYKFVRWITGSQIVLDRNDDYWDKAHIRYPKRLLYEVVQEPYVAAQLLKKGEIDIFDGVSPIIWKYDLDHSRAMDKMPANHLPVPPPTTTSASTCATRSSPTSAFATPIDLLIPRDAILSQIYLSQYANKTSGYDMTTAASYKPGRAAHGVQTPRRPCRCSTTPGGRKTTVTACSTRTTSRSASRSSTARALPPRKKWSSSSRKRSATAASR